MRDDARIRSVKDLLAARLMCASSPQLRDPQYLIDLAGDVIEILDEGSPIWRKWNAEREQLLKSSIGCWVPIADLCDFLNTMPGPHLTATDVSQRLKAFLEEPNRRYFPSEELEAGCLELHEREKGEGTELSAIKGLLRSRRPGRRAPSKRTARAEAPS